MENVEKKNYSEDEIRKVAPGYRGKPENFDSARVGKKSTPKPPRKTPGNAARRAPTSEPPLPTNPQAKETAQRNEAIISKSIFGIDVSVTEIAPRQSFAANYAKVIDVAAEVYDGYRADEKELERLLVREEVAYYATAMLHLKLLEVKAKQGDKVLKSTEKDLHKATADDIFNIPQPLFAYLSELLYEKNSRDFSHRHRNVRVNWNGAYRYT